MQHGAGGRGQDAQSSQKDEGRVEAEHKAGESLMPSPIKPENLSLGEKQKIYLARTLLGNSSCILLDEPGSNLDEKTEHSLINYLLKLKEKS